MLAKWTWLITKKEEEEEEEKKKEEVPTHYSPHTETRSAQSLLLTFYHWR